MYSQSKTSVLCYPLTGQGPLLKTEPLCNSRCGQHLSYYIRQRIVLDAKRQAIYVNASMKEIAYHLGFDDIAHFSKFFKNVSGMSFTEFKKTAMRRFSFHAPL